MPRNPRVVTYFHLHLVSDSTGETLNAAAKAASAQFESAEPIEHVYALVRSEKQLDRVLQEIEQYPGVVLYTLMNHRLRERLELSCRALGAPATAVLDPVLDLFSAYLGLDVTLKPGRQHQLDANYFARIEALTYTMAHDDGQLADDLAGADVILAGVSRTSKTPTCIYLANRGVRAANVPLVPGAPLPKSLTEPGDSLIVGLVASPERVVSVRRTRLRALAGSRNEDYADPSKVRQEIIEARRLFERMGWPVIDVTRRSIEETAAEILNLLYARKAA